MDAAWCRSASIRAGVYAGVAGLATFLVLHHLWIVPIWFIAPVGTLVAAAGGAAVGAAYAELVPHLPPRPWTPIAVLAGVVLILVPAFAIAELRGPIFELDAAGSGVILVPGLQAAAEIGVGLLGSAATVGAGLGWLIGRSRRAAGTTALAALAFALGPGHNIPLLGGTRAVATELMLLAAVGGVASVVLVETHARLTRHRPTAS